MLNMLYKQKAVDVWCHTFTEMIIQVRIKTRRMKGWLHSGYINTIATYGKYLFGVTQFKLYRIVKAMIAIQGCKNYQSRSKKRRLLKGSLSEIIQVRYQRNSFREQFCLLKQFVLKRHIFLIVWEREEKKINVKQVENAQEERNPRVDSW